MAKQYETVIGLEVHVELATKTKIFCGCSTRFGGAVNSHTCPVCTGMPGALPVLNKKVVEYAIALGNATNCQISRYCRFDRKNYFYPDNPQNYQISQLYMPICTNGSVDIETSNGATTIRIHEMHMEEDAGKLIHEDSDESSLVDYNRSGVPLIEIVSEPDMRTADEVIAYLEKIRMICQYLGVSDCKLQEGSMRADVNLSVREVGSQALGTRTEMKNLNSFRAIQHAIEGECKRQIELIESGEQVIQETRRWDDNKLTSFAMRSKEDAKDYRYFPEPDLPPILISDQWIEEIKASEPEFQPEKCARYKAQYGLSDYDANILTQNRHMADMFEETAKLCGNPKKAANWFMGEVLRTLKEKAMDPEQLTFSPKNLAAIIKAMDEGKINQGNAQKVFAEVFTSDIEPLKYMEENGLMMVSDTGAIEKAVDEVLAENTSVVDDYHNGKDRAFGFLVGQVMKKMKGKGDPVKVNEVLRGKL
ncbi:MAG: Asp-tRNA(Asn)/Glu-tRNA(Gln) amidotransferase subunit GatB [Lachnospiraceae bacterium]|nr:Asp-tRNA(Asn)/Glu-tRNA(Gln) amidotransferase subunit GatB [Lachnospiraceae bacterium]